MRGRVRERVRVRDLAERLDEGITLLRLRVD